MRLAHAADIHLGHRAFQRLSPAGLNLRESDVARVFHDMISQWIALRPDLICIAGDLFDKSRPTNPAIVHAMFEFARLRRELPDALIVLCAGNHDQSRTADAGSILPLFSSLGVHVAEREAKRLTFPGHELAVLLVPDGARAALEPDPAYRYNVLVLHGGLEDVTPIAARGGRERLTAEDLHAERWTYIALGDYHCRRDFGPNCGYSGSIEFTSSNIWGEIAEHPKGFLEFDLTTGERTCHALTPARPVYDLPPIDATGQDAAAINAAIARNADEVPIEGAIVRQIIQHCPVALSRELDAVLIRSLRARAMHYQIDPRRPARVVGLHVARTMGPRLSIEEMLMAKLVERGALPGVDQQQLVTAGLQYLAEAERAESQRVTAVEARILPEQESQAA